MEPVDQILSELRRGAVVLAVLSQLDDEQYGYSLRERLSAQGLEIPEGTIYPLLRRLESQKLLDSNWKLEGNRPRRYYELSTKGRQALAELGREWRSLVQTVDKLIHSELRS